MAVGINYDYAKEVLNKYNKLGEAGIENLKNKHLRRRGGKKSLLTNKQLEKLAKELESRPPDGGIWTGPKAARWIEKENCIEKVWNSSGMGLLKKAQILLSKSKTQT